MYLVNAHQMREMDRFTIEKLGIPGHILMENAGQSVVEETIRRFSFERAVVLSGHGNNGGDGFVVARKLANQGYDVEVFLLGDSGKLSPDSRLHYDITVKHGVDIFSFDGNPDALRSSLSRADLIIDAMLGTGAKGELREPVKTAVALVQERQRCQKPACVVAVDIPTGIETDTGHLMGMAVKADLTVALQLPKWAHYLYPGSEYRGELVVRDISIPPRAMKQVPCHAGIVSADEIARQLPPRQKHSHKGTYGHVLLVAGSHEMRGAPVLAGKAALKSGSGLVTIAVPSNILPGVSSQVTEAVMWEWPEEEGHFSPTRFPAWKEKPFSCVAIGPGIGTWEGGKEWLAALLERFTCPVVLDADALNLLAENPDMLKQRKAMTVLTPHPGEMGRLSGLSTAEVEADRPGIARDFARKYGVYLILKGAYTLIATPEGNLYLNISGSPAMAKGGSGDVLTGMIASFIGQGMNGLQAICAGVYLHGVSGEICGEKSEYSTVATDLINHIGSAISQTMMVLHSNTHFPGN